MSAIGATIGPAEVLRSIARALIRHDELLSVAAHVDHGKADKEVARSEVQHALSPVAQLRALLNAEE